MSHRKERGYVKKTDLYSNMVLKKTWTYLFCYFNDYLVINELDKGSA